MTFFSYSILPNNIQRRPKKEICKEFYDNDIYDPAFPFPKTVINYIRKRANPIVLQKLFKSSKWFFAKQSTPICYYLRDRWNVAKAGATYINEKLVFEFEDGKNDFPINIIITTVFSFNDCGSPPADNLSKEILPRIHRCEAKYIDIKKQNINFQDLLLLIEHDNVYNFRMDECEIMDEDGKLVLLEKILKLLPNVVNLRKNKEEEIDEFCVEDIKGEPFDPVEFKKFIDANFSYYEVGLLLYFNRVDFAEEFIDGLKNVLPDISAFLR
uniref:Uncharacterized protein n=1 Tax=Panagrolaimus sp. ES5 TaxID=591445 RepID=A0AC34G160_9BILA